MALSDKARKRFIAAMARRAEAEEILEMIEAGGNPVAEAVAFSAGAALVGVDGVGDNAAPLAGTETRLDALDTAVAAIISSLQDAGLMAE